MAIYAVAIVIAVAMAAVAYAAPKLFWYWSQVQILNLQQKDSARLVDLHVAKNAPEPETVKVVGADSPDGQYL
jgi:hypothetical protein